MHPTCLFRVAYDISVKMLFLQAKDKLGPQIAGLVRARSTAFLDDYRTALYGKLKRIIKDVWMMYHVRMKHAIELKMSFVH